MFTGIIEGTGTVKQILRSGAGAKLSVDLGPLSQGVKAGDSISVDGACLTVAAISDETAAFDCMQETLQKSSFKNLRAGQRVNLERALIAGERVGGHFVTGHVDGAGRIVEKRLLRAGADLFIKIPSELCKFISAKGSIAVDGISLTVISIRSDVVQIGIIPHTLHHTTLTDKRPGDYVNIEVDILARYSVK